MFDPQRKAYHAWASAGRSRDPAWERFPDFVAALGLPPSPRHRLSRDDTNAPLGPGNATWRLPKHPTEYRWGRPAHRHLRHLPVIQPQPPPPPPAPQPHTQDELPPRPLTRADCANVPRPCPWVGCRQHLLLKITPAGYVRYPHDHDDPTTMAPGDSCTLDVAERGGVTLDEMGRLLGVTRERARQMESAAMRTMHKELCKIDPHTPQLAEALAAVQTIGACTPTAPSAEDAPIQVLAT